MVSGSKQDSRMKKGATKKFVLAKDPKQALMAGIVVLVFIINTIYVTVKYFMDQNAGSSSNASQTTQQATQQAAQQAATTASSGPNIALILVVLAIIGLIVGGVLYFLKKGGSKGSLGASASSVGKKAKFMLAKDPKQAAIAGIVVVIFLANSIYMIVKYFQEQNPPATQQNTTTSSTENGMNQQSMDPNNPNPTQDPNNPQTTQNMAQDANNIYSQTVNLQNNNSNNPNNPNNPNAIQGNSNIMSPQSSDNDVEVLSKRTIQKGGKTVLISVADSGRANPFLPDGEIPLTLKLKKPPAKAKAIRIPPVPAYLTAPPENALTASEASKIMTTTISGILYDKYSPSAIINIEGSDYLVKKGDTINRYKILSIDKTQVLVQLGSNIYKAGVGELLSLTNINFNNIANLNRKFGGNSIQVNVKKKSY